MIELTRGFAAIMILLLQIVERLEAVEKILMKPMEDPDGARDRRDFERGGSKE